MKENIEGHCPELTNLLRQPMGFVEKWGIFLAILFACLVLGSVKLCAQTDATTFRGCVKNEANEPMGGVNVIITKVNQKYKVIASARTEKNGMFHVSFLATADSVSLYCSGMSIKAYQENLLNKDSYHDIYVEEKRQMLKEVTVKARKIYAGGDTINYNVASFQSKNDQNIADVLKRLPGITVSDAGKISYKGMPIKNFYIEGLDLMKGRYGIATNNIDPNSVSTVQVLENHQDVKALKNLRPEERASINLKLKEGVKGVFNLIGTMGGGYGDNALWSGEAVATYFRRNSQLLATYKGNNAGSDLETELRSFSDNTSSYTDKLTGIDIPVAPGIDKRYYYFNQSNSATYNNIYRVGLNGNLGINVGILTDRDSRSSQTTTNSLLPDGTCNVVDETIAARQKKETAYGALSFIENKDKKYVKELLSFDYTSLRGNSDVFNENVIKQKDKSENYRLSNQLHLTDRTSKDRGFDFISKINIEKRPQNLFVDTNLYPEILASADMNQWVERKSLVANNQLGLLSSVVLGKLHVSPNVFCNVNHDKLESTLGKYENQLSVTRLNTGVGLEATCKINMFYAELYIPLGYQSLRLNDHNSESLLDSRAFVCEPNLRLTVHVASSHSIILRSSLSNENPGIESLYGQYILNNYRQLSLYSNPSLYRGIWFANKLSYNYKDIFKMIFLDMDLVWNRHKPKMLYGTTYEGVVEKLECLPSNHVADQKSIKLNISKGFDWKRMKMALIVDYNHTDAPILIQGEELFYVAQSVNMKMDISASICNWLSVSHSSTYFTSKNKMDGVGSKTKLSSMNNETNFDVYLPGDVSLTSTLSHYYNSLNEKNKSFVLCDLSAKYSYKRWMFTLQCNNLFNKTTYSRSSSYDLAERIANYHIRQRGVMFKVRYRIL